ncbi:hypothetical protein DFH11DRAFT_1548014 [Phellopilus nigrolimitatus]|nr:hypothetical protein DFH11DRAFT_1548014 [Phellopilus nigrolimitatus]
MKTMQPACGTMNSTLPDVVRGPLNSGHHRPNRLVRERLNEGGGSRGGDDDDDERVMMVKKKGLRNFLRRRFLPSGPVCKTLRRIRIKRVEITIARERTSRVHECKQDGRDTRERILNDSLKRTPRLRKLLVDMSGSEPNCAKAAISLRREVQQYSTEIHSRSLGIAKSHSAEATRNEDKLVRTNGVRYTEHRNNKQKQLQTKKNTTF